MRFGQVALVATLLVSLRAEAQRPATPPLPPRTGFREAFRLELKRSVLAGHAHGAGPVVTHSLLMGVMTKVALTVPPLALPIAATTLPIVTPTLSRLGWRNGDQNQPRRFLGWFFRLTTRLGVGITVGSFAVVNAAWNTFDSLRGRPTMSMIERFRMRERAGEAHSQDEPLFTPPTVPSQAPPHQPARAPTAAPPATPGPGQQAFMSHLATARGDSDSP